MKKTLLAALALCLSYGFAYSCLFNHSVNLATKMQNFETDSFTTKNGKSLKIAFFEHASSLIEHAGKELFINPVSDYADFTQQPKADYILITHEHHDHSGTRTIAAVETPDIKIIANPDCQKILDRGQAMKNGNILQVTPEIRLGAIPTYSTTPGRDKFHPKRRDNGYILVVGDIRICIAGDTEDIPEMKQAKSINIAFPPTNRPYTMTPERTIQSAKTIQPHILYPYHYGDANINEVKDELKNEKEIEAHIRTLQ